MLRNNFGVLAAIVVGLASILGSSDARGEAEVFVVHGIPGVDLNLDPTLPVDVSVNGACALPGFTFGQIVGPLSLPQGSYDIAISLANPDVPCGNAAVLGPVTLALDDDKSYSIVAYLMEDGTPTSGLFENEIGASRGSVFVNVFHTAAAPPVDISLMRGNRGRTALTVNDLANGEEASAMLLAGAYRLMVFPAGSPDAVFGPTKLTVRRNATGYLVYAVGSLRYNTFTLLVADVGSSVGDDDSDGNSK
jgi:hypothetical protein